MHAYKMDTFINNRNNSETNKSKNLPIENPQDAKVISISMLFFSLVDKTDLVLSQKSNMATTVIGCFFGRGNVLSGK